MFRSYLLFILYPMWLCAFKMFSLPILPLYLCSHCIQQILESVNHCHLNGIVHRDLKVSIWSPWIWIKKFLWFCFFPPGERAEVGGALKMVFKMPFPAFSWNEQWNDNAWWLFSLLVYRLNIHHSRKERTAPYNLLRFQAINYQELVWGQAFLNCPALAWNELSLWCMSACRFNTTSVLRPRVAGAGQLATHWSLEPGEP